MPVPVTIDEHSNYLARLLAIVRLFAAVHESGSGPSRHFVAMQNLVAIEGITDIEQAVPMSSRLARCSGRTPSSRGHLELSHLGRDFGPRPLSRHLPHGQALGPARFHSLLKLAALGF